MLCDSVNQVQLNTTAAVLNICGLSFEKIVFEELGDSEEISDHQQKPNSATWKKKKITIVAG